MDRKEFASVWLSASSVREVSETLSITEQSAYYWGRKFGLPVFNQVDDETPTKEEIEERSAAIRATWSPAEMQRRDLWSRVGRCDIPAYTVHVVGRASRAVYVEA